MIDLFTRHPESVGETYLEHMGVASSFGFRMIFAGFDCLGHALLPFLFVKTGSAAITELHDRMMTNRHNQTDGVHSAVAAGSD
ncbi:MAG: hypothetical protein CMM46_00045 [Rhodospirillaceae bacterium]|nr:hypothetical protein [Rhodospirillaceae bacterium]|tara:strand:+ start:7160 stop:7408 length:249 start_codon:yes stop_codon:yes gene_type:complete